MKALLVVDLQYDFLPGGSLAVERGDEIIPIINEIQTHYDLIIATQDWHPKMHKSFASQHPNKHIFDVVTLNGQPQVLWPDHCVQGTMGASFSDAWESEQVAAIFRKGMLEEVDSYSGFYDNNRENSTGLLGYLRDKNVEELHICGLAADFCVYYSAKDAVLSGIKTSFLSFATRAISVEGFAKAEEDMLSLGISIVTTKEALLHEKI